MCGLLRDHRCRHLERLADERELLASIGRDARLLEIGKCVVLRKLLNARKADAALEVCERGEQPDKRVAHARMGVLVGELERLALIIVAK